MSEPSKRPTAAQLSQQLTKERRQHEATLAKLTAMQFERDFWVEQARALQNQLQTVMRGQAAILNQIATSSLTNEDVKEHCNRMAEEMRQPLTSVEAVRAITATVRDGTQGKYTAVSGKSDETKDLGWGGIVTKLGTGKWPKV